MIEVVSDDINSVLKEMEQFRQEFMDEVFVAYEQRGKNYGDQNFGRWNSRFESFVNQTFPSEVSGYKAFFSPYGVVSSRRESDADKFFREKGDKILSFIDAILSEIGKKRFILKSNKPESEASVKKKSEVSKGVVEGVPLKKVFIVHGHDELEKNRVARFIEKLGLEAIILHEQSSSGKTIIEKIEEYSDVGFGIILYTPDDHGSVKTSDKLEFRARQNVVFEHGYMIAKLGRSKVCALVKEELEIPNDISGIVYIGLDRGNSWSVDLAKELRTAGYTIDMNSVI